MPNDSEENGITFIIPSFNGHGRVKEAIQSALNSEGISIQKVLVIDDGSNPSLQKTLIVQDPRVEILSLENNRGIAEVRNIGINYSKTEKNIFFDDDVRLKPTTALLMDQALGEYDLVHTIPFWKGRGPMLSETWSKKYPKITACFAFNKRSLTKLDELFDTTYHFAYEDIDFFFRCMLFGLRAHFLAGEHAWHLPLDLGRDSGKRFVLSFRHNLYFNMKLRRFKSPRTEPFFGHYPVLNWKHYFTSALANFDRYKDYYENYSLGYVHGAKRTWLKAWLYRFKQVLKPTYPLTNRPRFVLWWGLLAGIFWGAAHFHKAKQKQKELRKKLVRFGV